MADLNQIAKKWQQKWEEAKLFEASPSKKEKFFINFPYPYINSYLHLGHAFSVTRVDVFARYKRMKGYNVLFPQAWHCTGTPVWAAAQRIKENEPKQLQILESLGFKKDEIKKFADVRHWIDVFVPAAEEDLQRLGAGIDWRRSFITTDMNPRYDRFIRWQFRKLKEKGYIVKGRHPVVWCPKDKMPVGDHDRVEGEGETPQQFLLVRHKLPDKRMLVSATLRQDTILGITNLFVHPDVLYEEIEIDTSQGKQQWIIGSSAVERLLNQGWDLKRKGKIKGIELIGKETEEFGGRKVPILPATFLDPEFGTGLVHSVPSDSADDLIALLDFQKNEPEIKKYGLDKEKIKKIVPIGILETEGYGSVPAKVFLEKENVRHQNEREKLDRIRKELYKMSFYAARFGKVYKGVFEKDIAGEPVQKWKEYVKEELIKKGWVECYYELTGSVTCRCLTKCVVKTVSDQWFLKYGDEKWKHSARKALSRMRLYPETARAQFNYVIGWLNDWACTHHQGTGTKLPWDGQWVIESLSDSTIYMAYYTIAHLIKEIPENEINDEFFDYIFLGIGKKGKRLEAMRKEFEYWYPFDIRSSGKDLIQNHMAFCLFNHAAVFPEKYWPNGFSVNGWLLVDGEKMSKSKGNFFTIREIVDKYPADAARASLMIGGEGINDPNFNFDNANAMKEKIEEWLEFAVTNYKPAKKSALSMQDKILMSAMHRSLKEGTEAMEQMLFRTAFEKLFFQMQKALREYMRKSRINQHLLNEFIEVQTKAISPFCPFAAEEIWDKTAKKGFISSEKWPEYDESKIDTEAETTDYFIEKTRRDIIEILKLAKIDKPKKITLFVADKWKYDFVKEVKSQMEKTRNPGDLIKKMAEGNLKAYSREIAKLVPKLLDDETKIPKIVLEQNAEIDALNGTLSGYEEEFKCSVEVVAAENTDHPKSRQAFPSKAAILVEK